MKFNIEIEVSEETIAQIAKNAASSAFHISDYSRDRDGVGAKLVAAQTVERIMEIDLRPTVHAIVERLLPDLIEGIVQKKLATEISKKVNEMHKQGKLLPEVRG